jgi:uncharacterized membrane protein
VSLVLCVAGLGLSAYLTYAHFTSPATLACPDSGVVNCTKVTTSPEAMLFGVIPVAVTGLPYFVAMTALCLPQAWRSRNPVWRWARIGGAAVGMAMVCYLLYVELIALRAICLYCTAVHVVTFLLLAAILTADALRSPEPEQVEQH